VVSLVPFGLSGPLTDAKAGLDARPFSAVWTEAAGGEADGEHAQCAEEQHSAHQCDHRMRDHHVSQPGVQPFFRRGTDLARPEHGVTEHRQQRRCQSERAEQHERDPEGERRA
jgi:hypothetical protein